MGGTFNVVHQTSSKIMDSFGDVATNANSPASNIHQQTTQVISQLKIAPKWMKKPCGARFGFGGKLVQFGKNMSDNQHQDQELNRKVSVSQVITDQDLVEKAQYLQSVLATGNLIEYCNYKIEIADQESDSTVWKYIMATFYKDKKEKILQLLGIASVKDVEDSVFNGIEEIDLTENTDSFEKLNLEARGDGEDLFDRISDQTKKAESIKEEVQIDLSFDNGLFSVTVYSR